LTSQRLSTTSIIHKVN